MVALQVVRQLVAHVVHGALVQDALQLRPGLVHLVVFAPDDTRERETQQKRTRVDARITCITTRTSQSGSLGLVRQFFLLPRFKVVRSVGCKASRRTQDGKTV